MKCTACKGTGHIEQSTRSLAQNNALHLWFKLVADELNAGGYTVQLVMREKVDLDWNATMVKELLWKSAQNAILGVSGTRQLRKIEDIDAVYDHLNRHLAEKFHIHVPFPHDEERELAPMKHE